MFNKKKVKSLVCGFYELVLGITIVGSHKLVMSFTPNANVINTTSASLMDFGFSILLMKKLFTLEVKLV